MGKEDRTDKPLDKSPSAPVNEPRKGPPAREPTKQGPPAGDPKQKRPPMDEPPRDEPGDKPPVIDDPGAPGVPDGTTIRT